MGCDRHNYESAVGRKTAKIFAIIGEDTEEALGFYAPRKRQGDYVPITPEKAAIAFVGYIDGLEQDNVSAQIREGGLVAVCLNGCVRAFVQMNSSFAPFNRRTVCLTVSSRDINGSGKLSRSSGGYFLRKIVKKLLSVEGVI